MGRQEIERELKKNPALRSAEVGQVMFVLQESTNLNCREIGQWEGMYKIPNILKDVKNQIAQQDAVVAARKVSPGQAQQVDAEQQLMSSSSEGVKFNQTRGAAPALTQVSAGPADTTRREKAPTRESAKKQIA